MADSVGGKKKKVSGAQNKRKLDHEENLKRILFSSRISSDQVCTIFPDKEFFSQMNNALKFVEMLIH